MRPNQLICPAIALLCSAAVSVADLGAAHGSSIQIDNDMLSGQDHDRDYSFGGTVTFDMPSSNRLFLSRLDAKNAASMKTKNPVTAMHNARL